ncbi:MAG: arylsulfatase [Acidimicrobiia bacterium]|nr:arylsulfatase [Acidimicrobiia bacterium]
MTQRFEGTVGDTWRESEPWWPPDPTPPANAPNVVLVVLDDVGYAQLGCYGSDIATPVIDGLAARGVRLANFHTTALCSPTRACLLTGRNHHSNGMARVADLAVGFPGYNGIIPKENGFLSEILGEHGYMPLAVGKWHLTPGDETHFAAPRDSWPCGRGFRHWYGFHGGETHQFVPNLFRDHTATLPPRSEEEGYHLTEDLADEAIAMLGALRSVEPEMPFYLHFATGACHSPHHAPDEWREQYRGKFDQGWDHWREETFARQQALGLLPEGTQLSPRPHWVPAWDELEPDDQAVAARFQECFAAFLAHTDAQIGRVLEFVEELGETDNTIVVVVSDNGASSEGGSLGSINDARIWNGVPAGRKELRARVDEIGTASTHNNYPWGWTMAGNTPFRRWKREVHEGGIADPCIVHWPAGIRARDEIRPQFAHAIDVLPTLLELIGVDAPAEIGGIAQAPIEGTSFAYLLDDGAAPEQHTTQYFEMLGSRAIYHDGWKAVTFKPLGHMYDDGIDPDAPFDEDVWELFDVRTDPSETTNLAEHDPERLAAMIDLWWEEARKYQVLPLDNRPVAALLAPRRPFHERDHAVFWPTNQPVPEENAINVRGRSHELRATVDIPVGVAPQGVLLAMGTVLGGWSFQVLDGCLRYVSNYVGRDRYTVEADVLIGPGAHELVMRFDARPDFSGTVHLLVDDVEVGTGEIPRTTPVRHSISGAGMTCGWEQGPPVGPGYAAPFRFTGTLHQVTVSVHDPARSRDPATEFEVIMSEQ